MSNKILIETSEGPVEVQPIYNETQALFMRPYATPVQVTEAIRRAHEEVLDRMEDLQDATAETMHIILEFHLDDVLGHGDEPAFIGN